MSSNSYANNKALVYGTDTASAPKKVLTYVNGTVISANTSYYLNNVIPGKSVGTFNITISDVYGNMALDDNYSTLSFFASGNNTNFTTQTFKATSGVINIDSLIINGVAGTILNVSANFST